MGMTPVDVTPRILERIQGALVGIQQELTEHGTLLREHGAILREHSAILREHGRIFVSHDQRLKALERHAATANEVLGLMSDRLSFFERAATATSEARQRLEARVDEIQTQLYHVDTRVGVLEAREKD